MFGYYDQLTNPARRAGHHAIALDGGLDPGRLRVFPKRAEETGAMHGPILAMFGDDDP